MTLGVILALLAAARFGFNGATVRRGVSLGPASQGMYITIFFGLLLFIVASVLSGQLFKAGDISTREYGFLVAGGIVHILAGRYTNYRAISALGANRAGPVVGLSTLASIGIAVVVLDESVNALQGLGIALVMVGPAWAAPRRRHPVQAAPSGASGTGPPDQATAARSTAAVHTPKVVEGYLFGLLTALLWGTGPVLMRDGLDSSELGILGGTVAYAVAAVVLLFMLMLPGQAAGALTLDKGARRWFAVSAVNSFLANVFRFSALAVAPVSVVIPLMRTGVLFLLAFNFFMNRSIESFEPRVLVGIFISLAAPSSW